MSHDWQRLWRGVVTAALVAAFSVVVYALEWHRSTTFWGYFFAACFGAATGVSEIISRYRDEPLLATINRYGLSYAGANGALSAGAFALLSRYSEQLFPTATADWLLRAFWAGFGAMVVMRSKLFIFRSDDGKDYPIGPAIVMETFLRMLDRKIDRYRASKRQARVFTAMRDITDFDTSADYLSASLLSFQNLSEQEKAEIATVIKDYTDAPWPVPLKCAALGLAFLTIAGEENFDQVIGSLKTYLATLAAQGGAAAAGVGPGGAAGGGP